MADKGYIHIDPSVFKELHLSGNDAILYSLVAGYCNSGSRFECKIEDIARRINISERSVRYTINNLVRGGFINKERKQFSIEIRLSDAWRTANIAEQERQTLPRRTANIAEQERQTLPNTHYIINNSNKTNNKGGEVDFFEILNKSFADQYQVTHGRPYAPNFSTHTTATRNLIDSLKQTMTADGYHPDIGDNFETYTKQWLDLAWTRSDQWHKERWSMEQLNSQFNYYNTIVNQQNGNQHQQPGSTRQQRGGGISDEYIAKQFEKLSRGGSAAGRPAGDAEVGR